MLEILWKNWKIVSFITAEIEKENYRPENIDIFRDDVSLPGIIYPICYRVSCVSCPTSFFSLHRLFPTCFHASRAPWLTCFCVSRALHLIFSLIPKMSSYLHFLVPHRLCILCALVPRSSVFYTRLFK